MNRRQVFGGIFLYALIIFVIFYLRLGGDNNLNLIFFINISCHLIALVFGLMAIKYFHLKTLQGKSVFFLSLAVFTWMVGEIIWRFYEEAVVSPADFFYLLGYPFATLSILIANKVVNPDYFKDKKHILYLIILVIISSFFYFNVNLLEWNVEKPFIENLVTSGYVIADFILIIPLLSLILKVWKGKYIKSWIWIGLGILLIIIGDTIYAVNYETYEKGTFIDLLWYYAYLFFAAGFFCMKKTAEETLIALKPKKS